MTPDRTKLAILRETITGLADDLGAAVTLLTDLGRTLPHDDPRYLELAAYRHHLAEMVLRLDREQPRCLREWFAELAEEA